MYRIPSEPERMSVIMKEFEKRKSLLYADRLNGSGPKNNASPELLKYSMVLCLGIVEISYIYGSLHLTISY